MLLLLRAATASVVNARRSAVSMAPTWRVVSAWTCEVENAAQSAVLRLAMVEVDRPAI